MTRLILSTSNIVSGGPSIVRKGNDRSNLELTNSLRANFLNAQEDYSPPVSDSETNGHAVKTNGNRIAQKPASSIWTLRDGNDYFVPRIDWSLAGLAEERSAYDITAKLFYVQRTSTEVRAQQTRDAIGLVMKELQVDSIDLLIVSFPGLSFEGDCEWEADKRNSIQGDDAEEIASWPALEKLQERGTVKRLGLAEFGSHKLARFNAVVKIKPVVDQINVKDCCNVPPPLIEYAREENIELLTHNDCTDILPTGTMRELLGHGPDGAGVLSDGKRSIDGMKGELVPQWVIKYTAVVQDRGVIENKGYFAAADLKE